MSEYGYEIKGSLTQYEEFVRTTIWADFVGELGSWLEAIRDSLESTEDVDEIRLLQGNAQGLRKVLQLPTNIIEAYKESQRGN